MNKKPVIYYQTDPRWRNLPYRVTGENATIGDSGCGPTAAAMIVETMTGKTFTPVDACKWAVERGYKALNQGTYYSYFAPQFAAFGIECKQLNWASGYGKPDSPVHKQAFELLKQGYYLIALMSKGLWTSGGHFVVVWWEDGKVKINDPASSRPERLNGDMTRFKSECKYYWAIDARKFNNKDDAEMTETEIKTMVADAVKQALDERDKAQTMKATETAEWSKPAWDKAVAAKIFDGSNPGGPLTREQAAVIIVERLDILP